MKQKKLMEKEKGCSESKDILLIKLALQSTTDNRDPV